MERKIAVIGGGAAGMMAAIQAAEAGAAVELYERNNRVGRKLLSTGNGKCNFSNEDMRADAYYGSAVSFYEKLYALFGVRETIDFFSQHGMLFKNKNGYLYPLSEQASTVLDILRLGLEKNHVCIHTDSIVEAIKIEPKSTRLQVCAGTDTKDRNKRSYDAVILACGGMAAPGTGSDGNGFKLAKALGHHVTEVVPALVQLRCREDFLKSVAGVRSEAGLTLLIDGKEKSHVKGELQLTDYGISGIPVFQFSREAAYAVLHKKEVKVEIDFLPQFKDVKAYDDFWKERWEKQSKQTLEQFLTGVVNKKINQLIIRMAGCKSTEPAGAVMEDVRERIAILYRKFPVSVYETNGFTHAQVSAGGIPAEELTENLESKLVPHLYFAGEIIDMDGICGGYNLQWAWTSGTVAGRAAAGCSI